MRYSSAPGLLSQKLRSSPSRSTGTYGGELTSPGEGGGIGGDGGGGEVNLPGEPRMCLCPDVGSVLAWLRPWSSCGERKSSSSDFPSLVADFLQQLALQLERSASSVVMEGQRSYQCCGPLAYSVE